MGATSLHFSNTELACHHCHLNNCKQELVDMLEQFRTAVGKPITINDAYRCPQHNKDIGGAIRSQHVLGMAADVSVQGLKATELEVIAHTCSMVTGIGRNDHSNYIHLDTRLIPAKWCYNTTGSEIPYYPPIPNTNSSTNA